MVLHNSIGLILKGTKCLAIAITWVAAVGFSTGVVGAETNGAVLTQAEFDLVSRLRNRDMRERADALQAIFRLERGREQLVLLSVADTADDDSAASACRRLLTTYASETDPNVIGQALVRRSNWFRAIVLQECLYNSSDTKRRQCAQYFVEHMLVGGHAPADDETCDSLGLACQAMSSSGDSAVSTLLRQAGRSCSRSRRVWLAIAAANAARDDVFTAAQETYRKEDTPDLVRIAAATAAASQDSQAEAFVLAQIKDFVSQFATEDPGRGLLFKGEDRVAYQKYKQFRDQLGKMTSLRFLPAASAKEAAAHYALVTNDTLRDIALLTICLRWPETFIKDIPKYKLDDKKTDQYLAVIEVYHGDDGKKLITDANLSVPDTVLTNLRKAGLTGFFGLAGSVVLGL